MKKWLTFPMEHEKRPGKFDGARYVLASEVVAVAAYHNPVAGGRVVLVHLRAQAELAFFNGVARTGGDWLLHLRTEVETQLLNMVNEEAT